ncbi:hypothetical protein DICPUDRAFT_43022 [Dictyostelium purpureum]|uniref:VTT domain-containing protein n=1 Tax=Dictyostelium purpureum TaxID=5786 RepID=F1A3B4_DICPU|nr:uncharacterized protein DICPUDRAFT_43022 [Dictyostelium purpureum]EGC29310.1 hypothetical protein DICPUDRAFT_43022 [Dictyostelium purpureum]|eukprot:XP_003294158.1 hypothetical protein DICPUDRAFT_43022 [Dictyostelium purpureum]
MDQTKYISLNRNFKSIDAKKIIRLSLILVLSITILILFILLFIPNSPVNRVTLSFMEWIKQIPKGWGCILLTIIYAVSLVFCFPGTPINLAAGFLFGPYLGSVSTVLGCDIGAILAFFIGRNLTKDWTTSKMNENEKYSQINSAVSKNGLLIIFLLRLSPAIPFGICNYIFGATNVSFFNYWVGTTLGLLPFTILYTYLGSSFSDLSEVFNDSLSDEEKSRKRFYGLMGITFSFILIVAITIITKRALNNAMVEKKINKDGLDLEQGTELPLIESKDIISNLSTASSPQMNGNINIQTNNSTSTSNTASTALNNNKKAKAIFKRSPTDTDLDSNSTTEEFDSNDENNSSKDIILTINDHVEFQNDDEDFDNNNDNDKTFLIKNNYQNPIQKQIK